MNYYGIIGGALISLIGLIGIITRKYTIHYDPVSPQWIPEKIKASGWLAILASAIVLLAGLGIIYNSIHRIT